MGARSFILLGLVAVLVGYLFSTPIPDGIVDPMHYRLISAGYKTAFLMAYFRSFFQSGDHIYYETISSVTNFLLPSEDAHVAGSNVQARYTEFDGVRILVYEPIAKAEGLVPGLVYYHGGGYAIGSPKSHSPLTRYMAEKLDIVVVSIDYRLAPTNPFPAGFDDCLKATKWFLSHALEFGVDANRVVVSGDSAGGHLSAVMSMHLHDDPSTQPGVKLQVLFYPWLQIFDLNTPSYQSYVDKFGDTGIVAKSSIARFISALLLGRFDQTLMAHVLENAHTSEEFKQSVWYRKVLDHGIVQKRLKIASSGSVRGGEIRSNATLWDEMKDRMLDPRISPLFREDFTGLPKAFIATADMDSLRDDGIFYASLLEEAGVEVKWRNYEGAYHAIAAAGPVREIPTGVRMLDDAIAFIRENI